MEKFWLGVFVIVYVLYLIGSRGSKSSSTSFSSGPRDTTQWTRGPIGEVLGRTQELGDGDLIGFDQMGNMVGRYSRLADMTYDQNGRMLTRGNTLSASILKSDGR
jgi:hypothetical protein